MRRAPSRYMNWLVRRVATELGGHPYGLGTGSGRCAPRFVPLSHQPRHVVAELANRTVDQRWSFHSGFEQPPDSDCRRRVRAGELHCRVGGEATAGGQRDVPIGQPPQRRAQAGEGGARPQRVKATSAAAAISVGMRVAVARSSRWASSARPGWLPGLVGDADDVLYRFGFVEHAEHVVGDVGA